ncbi:MAG: MltA domain-containing protein [Rhizobiales bacterium]|nr:MltA domain-containing protein [Hyphomicrobiales bacterium]
MKKVFGAVLLSLLGLAAFPVQAGTTYPRGGVARAATGYDPVQRCLDLVQLNVAGKISPAHPVTSRSIQNPPKDLPIGCLAGNLTEIKSALRNQIANCERKSAEEKARTFQFGCRMVKNEDYCLNANTEMLKIASLPNMDYATFVNRAAREFDWYKSNGRQSNDEKFATGTTRFTGYYSPTAVDASADPSDVYRYPIYAAPDGLTYFENPKPELGQGCGVDEVTKVPIHWCIDNKDGTFSALPTREQMAKGASDGKIRKIAYFRSLYEVSNFMLEGAGSVNLRHKDGSVESVVLNFAGTNGRPNNMIGDVLKCENKKINGSLATYYAHRPDEAYRDTVHYNPSTIFYRPGVSYEGVDHIPVTPNASIATDPAAIPTGTVTLLNGPATNACRTVSSMAVAQDIGGRIKGPHIDVYTGAGLPAGTKANSFNNSGFVFMAVPKGAGTPIPGCVAKTAN